jgi:hypothetical protein
MLDNLQHFTINNQVQPTLLHLHELPTYLNYLAAKEEIAPIVI